MMEHSKAQTAYSQEVARQIFGYVNFPKQMETAIPIAFISDCDSQLSVNPEAEALFTAAPEKLGVIIQAIKQDCPGPTQLISCRKTVTFCDFSRDKHIDSPGTVYYGVRSELEKLKAAA